MGSVASADPIQVQFNFVPNGTLTADTGDVTTANTITAGAPDTVTSIVTNNIGLTSGTNISLTDPTPVTLGSVFQKSFTTVFGTFLEILTVNSVTPGSGSLGIQATGTITQTSVVGTAFDPNVVFYSAAYTQNAGPGAQINGTFNNGTLAVPGPIAGAGVPSLIFASAGLLGWWRRKRKVEVAA